MKYPDYLVHYNKNHDKKTGRFTFGDGNGDGVSPDDYRTPELDNLDKKYGNDIRASMRFQEDGDVTSKKDADIINFGIKALDKIGFPYGPEYTDSGTWNLQSFLDEDMFDGWNQLAYLIYNGYDKTELNRLLEANEKCHMANHKYKEAEADRINKKVGYHFTSPYMIRIDRDSLPYNADSIYLYFTYNDITKRVDKRTNDYIDACLDLAKEMEHSDMDYSSIDYSEYLMHFNKNHDKKSGKFTYGDGDGDGIRDDHSNQSKKQSTSDGSKKTLVVSSPKNPRNPFSGHKKTKIEVSDEAYKEVMKADTKHAIKRGTGYLLSGGALIAAGVLTENPVALGVGAVYLVSSAAHYVDSGTHFVNKMIDSAYKNKPVEELDTLVKVDPSIFNTKYYDTNLKEIRDLSFKDARKEVLDRAKKS